MKVKSQVSHDLFRAMRSCAVAACALFLVGTAGAQSALTVEQLEERLAQQQRALQEAIADREATAFRAQEVASMLAEAEEAKAQIEEDVKMLCEEQEALKAGSFDECMSTSNN